MITKDQIKQAALARGFKLSNDAGDDLKPYVYEFARDMIALAQEVRPLVFAQSGVSSKTANTNYGPYSICNFIDELRAAFPEDKYYARKFESEAEAIAAAQADFNRRVLENLTHGVVE